jgi:hypothetical protein
VKRLEDLRKYHIKLLLVENKISAVNKKAFKEIYFLETDELIKGVKKGYNISKLIELDGDGMCTENKDSSRQDITEDKTPPSPGGKICQFNGCNNIVVKGKLVCEQHLDVIF